LLAVETIGRRERKKLALRDKIREQTVALVIQSGIAGVTIDAICDRADIAKKTFYNYYSSKHELFNDVCQVYLLNHAELMVQEAQSAHDSLPKQLGFIFEIMSQSDYDTGTVHRELISYLAGTMAVTEGKSDAPIPFLNGIFLKLYQQGRGDIKPGLTASFCAEMTTGMIYATAFNWLLDDDYDLNAKFEELSHFVQASMLK